MRVLLVLAVLLAILAAWIGWNSQHAPEHAEQRTETIDSSKREDGNAEDVVLAPVEAAETAGRAPASATSGTMTTFHVIDARSGAPIERFDLQIVALQGQDAAAAAKGGRARYERHAGGLVRALHLPGAECTVVAPGYESIRSRVQPDTAHTDTQTIRMRRAGGIEGRVSVDGRPAVGVRVFAQRDHAGSTLGASASYAFQVGQYSRWWSEYETDEAGRFIVTGVAAGTYALRFEVLGAASVLRRGIVVPIELSVDIGEVVLEREAIVRGSIIPPADEPPSSIAVMLDGAAQVSGPPASVDFEFRGLAAGMHELTWSRRDGADRSFESESRRMQLDLKAGEVREVIVESTGSAACELTVRVRINGLPAARCVVRATTDLESSDARTSWIVQATTDASGLGALRLPAAVRIRIGVLDERMHSIGGAVVPIEMAAGEAREFTIDLELGTLVVELPSSCERPALGGMTLELRPAKGDSIHVFASTTPNTLNPVPHPVWNSNRIDFGAYPAGEYTARLQYLRVFEGTNPMSAPAPPTKSPFEPFETKITVVGSLETVIAVPK